MIQYNWCHYKWRKLDTDVQPGRTPCKDWSYATTNQGHQRLLANHQKLGGEHGTDFPSHFQKEPAVLTP